MKEEVFKLRHSEGCKERMKAKIEHQARKEKYFTNLVQTADESVF